MATASRTLTGLQATHPRLERYISDELRDDLEAALKSLEAQTDVNGGIILAPTTGSTSGAVVGRDVWNVDITAMVAWLGVYGNTYTNSFQQAAQADDNVAKGELDAVTGLGAMFLVMTGPTSTDFAVGDYVNMYNVVTGDDTLTVLTAVGGANVTGLDAVGTAIGDTGTLVKINNEAAVAGSALDATFVEITGPTQANFSVGDYVSIYNATAGTKYLRTVIAADDTSITVDGVAGTGIADVTHTAKLSLGEPKLATQLAESTTGGGFDQLVNNADGPGDDYLSVGDPVHIWNATTTTSYMRFVKAVSGTIVTLNGIAGTAASDNVYISKLTDQPGVASTALGAMFLTITGPNNTQFGVGNRVLVVNTTQDTIVNTTVNAVAAGTITVEDVVGAAITDELLVFHFDWLRYTLIDGTQSITFSLVLYERGGTARLIWVAGDKALTALVEARSADYISDFLDTEEWRLIGTTTINSTGAGTLTQTYDSAVRRMVHP